eukprot:TRINITY_DN8757_c0_g1_i1.p1 TRINITY_DN8757_c0_g1~~TRINITY_DN8757_c0_g1_i1.p1  ORF type:complete len:361 (-),score=73.99 TRINITY_DN8757_c0_g1_i1:50-1096(-)
MSTDPYELGQSFFGEFKKNGNGADKPTTEKKNVTYWNYIRAEDLSQLQEPVTPHHDEHLFILVHQVFELWFKQIIFEIESVIQLFVQIDQGTASDDVLFYIIKYLERCITILNKSMVGFEIMETMDTPDFLLFRSQLGRSSGFQSSQFRQLETLLGMQERPPIFNSEGQESSIDEVYTELGCPYFHHELMKRAKDIPSIKSCAYNWLSKLEIPNIDQFMEHFFETKKVKPGDPCYDFFNGEDSAVLKNALFVQVYHSHPRWERCSKITNLLLKLEQSLVIWRYRHPRMAELIIGKRTGTGNSAGVDYLDSTCQSKYRIYPELIRVRGECLSINEMGELSDDGEWHKTN